MSTADEIRKLSELRDAGTISAEEFERAKARLLGTASAQSAFDASAVTRLRRSTTDRWLGGVCGGLGVITSTESWIWRLVFALAFFLGGFGLIPYVLLWIFVPDDRQG